MKTFCLNYFIKTSRLASVAILLIISFCSCKKNFEQMTPEEALLNTISELESSSSSLFSTGVFRNNPYSHAYDYYYVMKLFPGEDPSKGEAVIMCFLEDKNQEKVDSYVFRYRIEDDSSISFLQGCRLCNRTDHYYKARTVNTHIDGSYKKTDSAIEIKLILGQDRLVLCPRKSQITNINTRFQEKLNEY